jgi:hypothetical protein
MFTPRNNPKDPKDTPRHKPEGICVTVGIHASQVPCSDSQVPCSRCMVPLVVCGANVGAPPLVRCSPLVVCSGAPCTQLLHRGSNPLPSLCASPSACALLYTGQLKCTSNLKPSCLLCSAGPVGVCVEGVPMKVLPVATGPHHAPCRLLYPQPSCCPRSLASCIWE